MKNGLPKVYWGFRLAWSMLHLAMLAVLLGALLAWALTDNQGQELFDSWWTSVKDIRQQVAALIPYPWD